MKSSLIIALLLTTTLSAGAWHLTLTATGEVNPAPYTFSVSLGDSSVLTFLPAPPRPPQYATYIELYEPEWVSGPYLSMFYPDTGADTLIWLVNVDPNGNVMPPVARTTTIQWNSADVPSGGLLYLVDYQTGETIVPDLRSATSFSITGTDELYYNLYWVNATSVQDTEVKPPADYNLMQVFPNPFNPAARIQFTLHEASSINLQIYNLEGRQVVTLAEGEWAAGEHVISFDATRLSAGIYWARLLLIDRGTDERRIGAIQKMALVK